MNILDVFLLVLVRHLDISPALLQINHNLLAETLVVHGESGVNHVSDVILHGPGERSVEFGIDTLHVDESHLLLEDHLVECANEECIQETPVENGQTDHTTDELEVSKMLRVDSRVRVDLERVVVVRGVLEQAVEWVEHLVRK